jgi:hypothetical protein
MFKEPALDCSKEYVHQVVSKSLNSIQRFVPGTSNGATVAGNSSSPPISLNGPSAVALDGHGNLFIVDTNNHRIIRSEPSGFRCVVGSLSNSGSGADQLASPRAFSFDSAGNIYVVDSSHSRIQRFQLNPFSCPFGFYGAEYQFDLRPCQMKTCWNGGNLSHPPQFRVSLGMCNEMSHVSIEVSADRPC